MRSGSLGAELARLRRAVQVAREGQLKVEASQVARVARVAGRHLSGRAGSGERQASALKSIAERHQETWWHRGLENSGGNPKVGGCLS